MTRRKLKKVCKPRLYCPLGGIRLKNTSKSLGKLHKRNIETLVGMVAFLFLCLWISVDRVQNIQFMDTENENRILLKKYVEKIENGNYVSCDYPYLVISTHGDVLFQNQDVFQFSQNKVNVEEMLTVDEYSLHQYKDYKKVFFTIKQNQTVTGFVVFLVPIDETRQQINGEITMAFLPLMIGLVIAIGVFTYQMIYSKRRVYKPMEEITESARAIINGNYEKEVLRVYSTKIRANEVGQLTYSFELMRDELKEKQIKEEQLKKSQQELISCISHDLKTPISTIKAYTEGLRDGIARTDIERMEYVQTILEKTNLLNTMITELLEFSNTQLKQLDIKKEEIYLQDYLTPVMKELEGYVTYHSMKFFVTNTEENPIVIMDSKRITEVLYNLVENSIKYKQANDPMIHIHITRKEKGILIRVIDNGTGINANDIPYVFDKFYRAEKSRSSNIPGSGLGLSICKYIIEQHNGEIYCKNLTSSGCEFGFTIN